MARVKRTYYFIFQTITAGMAENTKDDIVEMSRLNVIHPLNPISDQDRISPHYIYHADK